MDTAVRYVSLGRLLCRTRFSDALFPILLGRQLARKLGLPTFTLSILTNSAATWYYLCQIRLCGMSFAIVCLVLLFFLMYRSQLENWVYQHSRFQSLRIRRISGGYLVIFVLDTTVRYVLHDRLPRPTRFSDVSLLIFARSSGPKIGLTIPAFKFALSVFTDLTNEFRFRVHTYIRRI
jgi:hypothetical protein